VKSGRCGTGVVSGNLYIFNNICKLFFFLYLQQALAFPVEFDAIAGLPADFTRFVLSTAISTESGLAPAGKVRFLNSCKPLETRQISAFTAELPLPFGIASN
jgi:hypothetical protein